MAEGSSAAPVHKEDVALCQGQTRRSPAAHALGERAAGMRTGRPERMHPLAVADE